MGSVFQWATSGWSPKINPFLLLLLDCHVCVDVVAAASCAKHLYKYIAKRATTSPKLGSLQLKVKSRCTALHDIFQLQKLRGRCWALNPTAVSPQLPVCTPTLEEENNVVYPADASTEERAAIARGATSDLMRYLKWSHCGTIYRAYLALLF